MGLIHRAVGAGVSGTAVEAEKRSVAPHRPRAGMDNVHMESHNPLPKGAMGVTCIAGGADASGARGPVSSTLGAKEWMRGTASVTRVSPTRAVVSASIGPGAVHKAAGVGGAASGLSALRRAVDGAGVASKTGRPGVSETRTVTANSPGSRAQGDAGSCALEGVTGRVVVREERGEANHKSVTQQEDADSDVGR